MRARAFLTAGAVLALVGGPVHAQSVPRDPQFEGLMSIPRDRIPENIVDTLVMMVRANDYRCDSVTNVTRWVWSRGFTVNCNRFAYEYEIADKGGHWIVTVK